MSEDIVTRLLEPGLCGWDTQKEAAAEIERLRHERLEWFLVARQLRDAAIAKQEINEALNDYLRARGRLEDPRDAVEGVRGE